MENIDASRVAPIVKYMLQFATEPEKVRLYAAAPVLQVHNTEREKKIFSDNLITERNIWEDDLKVVSRTI